MHLVGPAPCLSYQRFMCVSDQTQDLPCRLVLDHPRSVSQQIHKCIVALLSCLAVFDRNIQVNRCIKRFDFTNTASSTLYNHVQCGSMSKGFALHLNFANC